MHPDKVLDGKLLSDDEMKELKAAISRACLSFGSTLLYVTVFISKESTMRRSRLTVYAPREVLAGTCFESAACDSICEDTMEALGMFYGLKDDQGRYIDMSAGSRADLAAMGTVLVDPRSSILRVGEIERHPRYIRFTFDASVPFDAWKRCWEMMRGYIENKPWKTGKIV